MYRDSLSAYFNSVMYVHADNMETPTVQSHTCTHANYKTATHTSPGGDFHMLAALNHENHTHTHTLQTSDESDSSKH